MERAPPRSPLFPYTTLFRSLLGGQADPAHPAGVRARRLAHAARGGRAGHDGPAAVRPDLGAPGGRGDRKSTRLNSSHLGISYAVFCLKKKIIQTYDGPTVTE